jgi:hypothetical protein
VCFIVCSLWFANNAFSELFDFRDDVVFSPTICALLMIPIILLFHVYTGIWLCGTRGAGDHQMQKIIEFL